MKNNVFHFLLLYAIIFTLLTSCKQETNSDCHITPEPVSTELKQGFFTINNKTEYRFADNVDTSNNIVKHIKNFLVDSLKLQPGNNNSNIVEFVMDATVDNDEGYVLNIEKKKIVIAASTEAGLLYGLNSLYQLFLNDRLNDNKIRCAKIVDYPRFAYRGAHLDVCRHFFDTAFVKKYIDILAFHKINKFHWHLTDDHGWRIEIEKYPKLTTIGAWSVDRSDVPWGEALPPQKDEPATYGGYYTKAQIKDIVAYAKDRNIEIIPEIEMPGHSSAILAAYPEYSCLNDDDDSYFVQIGPYWPPQAILCAGKDETVKFMQDVLDEVAGLFESPYIHIGGDEAFNENWQKCPLCQKRIRDNHLENETQLQSWFMQQIENHLITKGKKVIGWDEILDGGISQTATVMSWRGSDGGIKAAKKGNHVIMVPNNYCYFDYYQADPSTEPKAIGGFVPLRKVYQYNPTPPQLSEEEAKFVDGGQCNIWTEFINTPDHVEYMLLPRLAALSERLWSPAEQHSWPKFQKKVKLMKSYYKFLGYNYCDGNFLPEIQSFSTTDGNVEVSITTEVFGNIHYTTDRTDPTMASPVYEAPLVIDKTTTIKAAVESEDDKGKLKPNVASSLITVSKFTSKTFEISPKPSEKYSANGIQSINDGTIATTNNSDGRWLGFQDDTITMFIHNSDNSPLPAVSKIFIGTLVRQSDWIFAPRKVSIYATTGQDSDDVELLASQAYDAALRDDEVNRKTLEFVIDNTKRYNAMKIVVEGLDKVPQWHGFAGQTPWLFIDEIWAE